MTCAKEQKRKLEHFQEELARCLDPDEARNLRSYELLGMPPFPGKDPAKSPCPSQCRFLNHGIWRLFGQSRQISKAQVTRQAEEIEDNQAQAGASRNLGQGDDSTIGFRQT